jgi:hypothetical protein
MYGQGSEQDELGAFQADMSDDVGSPGFFRLPTCYKIHHQGVSVTLHWRTIKGKSYQLEWRSEASTGEWLPCPGVHRATSSTLTTTDTPPPGTSQRFYRLREIP